MKPFDPRLLRYSRSSRGFLFLSASIALVTTLATIGIAFELSHIAVAIFQRHAPLHTLARSVAWLASAFTVKALAAGASQRIASAYSNKIRSELREASLRKILDGNLEALYEEGSASTALLLTRGINDLDGYFSKFLPQLFIAGLMPIIVGATIAYQDMNSGFIILFTVPLLPLFGYMIGRFTGALTTRKLQTLHQLSTYFLDLLEGVTTLKVFGRSKLQAKKIEEVGERYAAETLQVLKISFLSSLALELVATLSVALLAVSIGLRLVHGSLTLGVGLLVLILAPEVYWPIRQVALRFHDVEDGVAISDRIFTLLDSSSHQKSGEKISEIQSISWSDLTVEFPGRSPIAIPAGIISRGGINTLVGPSGSGKSTLFALLLGFLEPTTGEIFVTSKSGLKSYRDIDIDSLRSRIAWLPQEPHMGEGTIADFIGVSASQAPKVLERVALSPTDITGGVEASVGSMNDFLSYGQVRKLALARALQKDADLLLIDEPTASMDSDSESEISSTLREEVASGKLVFASTHRAGLTSHNEISLVGRR